MKKTLKKSLSFILSLVMLLGLLPMYAMADIPAVISGITRPEDVVISGTQITIPVSANDSSFDLSVANFGILYDPALDCAYYSDSACTSQLSGSAPTSAPFYIKIANKDNPSVSSVYTVNFDKKTTLAKNSAITDLIAGRTYNFKAADFDQSGTAGGILQIIDVSAAGGTLKYGSGSPGASIDFSDIEYLNFTPAAKGTATITFKVKDKFGTSTTTATLTMVVRDAVMPSVSAISKSVISLSSPYTFTAADFTAAYTKNDCGDFAAVELTSIPLAQYGTLSLSGALLNAGSKIPLADISAGKLVFTPGGSLTSSQTAVFGYKSGDALSGGNWSSASTITVSLDSSKPTLTSFSVSVQRNTAYTFSQSDFTSRFSGGTNLNTVRITSLPSSGTLTYNGSTFSATTASPYTISRTNLHLLKYNAPNVSSTTNYSFTWNGAASNGVYADSTAACTLSVYTDSTVTSGSFTKNINSGSGSPTYFSLSDFTNVFSSSAGRSLSSITIRSQLTYTGYGSLRIGGSTYSNPNGLTINASDIPNLNFLPNTNGSYTTSFTYSAYDGVNHSTSYGTVTLYLNSSGVTAGNFTKNVPLNTTTYFTQSDFRNVFSSSNATNPTRITITSVPSSSYGYLYTNSTRVYAGDNITYSNIPNLNFVPASNKSGTVTFKYTAYDGYNTSSEATITLRLGTSAVELSNSTKTTAIDTRLNFTLSDFTSLYSAGSSSVDGITIKTLPSSSFGRLYLGNSLVDSGDYITRSNISNLNFRPVSNKTGTTNFTFTVTDGSEISNTATMTVIIGSGSGSISGDAPYITSFFISDQYTTSRTIYCELSAYDPYNGSSPTRMQISINGGEYSAAQTYQPSFSYTLPNTEGQHTISVKVSNSSGKISEAASASVIYDTTSPQILAATISSDRKTIAVTFDEMITTLRTNDALKNSIQFAYSSSSYVSPTYSDTVSIANSTLTINLYTALPDTYDRITISGGTIYDNAGNYISASLQQSLTDSPRYSTSRNTSLRRATITFNSQTPSSSGTISQFVDPIALSEISGGLGFSDAELRFELPAASGKTATTRTITLPGELFTTTNINRIKNIILTDGSVDISISTAAVKNTLTDYSAPFSITISSVSLSDISASNPSFSRTITFHSGGNEITQLNGKDAIKFSAPYSSSSSSTENLIVVMRRDSPSVYTPVYSSVYSSNDASAYLNKSGTYVVATNNVTFSDIPSTFWAHTFISKLAARKVIEGTGAGIYSPDGAVTKAEFIKLLTASLNLVDENASCNMTDVTTDKWYYKYVASAVKARIISDNITLSPETPITREEMCLYAYLAAAASDFSFSVITYNTTAFTDQSQISSNCLTSVQTLQRAGIIAGYTDGRFDPKGTTRRSEAAKIISMIMDEQLKSV